MFVDCFLLTDGNIYAISEYVDGGNLQQLIQVSPFKCMQPQSPA
jgi:serine/threonine protein kinase